MLQIKMILNIIEKVHIGKHFIGIIIFKKEKRIKKTRIALFSKWFYRYPTVFPRPRVCRFIRRKGYV